MTGADTGSLPERRWTRTSLTTSTLNTGNTRGTSTEPSWTPFDKLWGMYFILSIHLYLYFYTFVFILFIHLYLYFYTFVFILFILCIYTFYTFYTFVSILLYICIYIFYTFYTLHICRGLFCIISACFIWKFCHHDVTY